ncbi:MAG: hypothetical protein EBU49_04955 [Proteobacteria bacterium]|nr:hypothetical protein [Pseudomonadota bacterium]
MTRSAAKIISILFLIFTANPAAIAQPIHRHFMIIYGFQDGINTPHGSHVFATFVESDVSPSGHDLARFEAHTLSWLPVMVDNRFLRLRPEPGRNFSLDETLQLAESRELSLMRWGPFEITDSLYFGALDRIDFLESGAADYIAQDTFYRNAVYVRESGGAINCIHAVSDLGGFIRTGLAHGFSAARRVYEHLQQFVVPSPDNNEWVATLVGVGDIPRADCP